MTSRFSTKYLTCNTRSFISTCLYVECFCVCVCVCMCVCVCVCVCEGEGGFEGSLIFPLLYLDDFFRLSR